jgi:hypothetical protein
VCGSSDHDARWPHRLRCSSIATAGDAGSLSSSSRSSLVRRRPRERPRGGDVDIDLL